MRIEQDRTADGDLTEASRNYAMFMYEIKYRLNVISRAVSAFGVGPALTGYRESDIEVCFLQLRKILELMMFASLVAHAAVGKELQKNIVDREWNASKILAYLERENPQFFPEAIRPGERVEDHILQMTPVEGALTQQEFRTLNDRICGKYLHASRDLSTLHDHASLFQEIAEWANKIKNLLSSHWIIVSNERAFAVLLATNPDGHVQVMPMEAEDS